MAGFLSGAQLDAQFLNMRVAVLGYMLHVESLRACSSVPCCSCACHVGTLLQDSGHPLKLHVASAGHSVVLAHKTHGSFCRPRGARLRRRFRRLPGTRPCRCCGLWQRRKCCHPLQGTLMICTGGPCWCSAAVMLYRCAVLVVALLWSILGPAVPQQLLDGQSWTVPRASPARCSEGICAPCFA